MDNPYFIVFAGLAILGAIGCVKALVSGIRSLGDDKYPPVSQLGMWMQEERKKNAARQRRAQRRPTGGSGAQVPGPGRRRG